MFSLAESSLDENKNLSKVVIMDPPPRFDEKVKSKLARLANATFNQLWLSSSLQNKIIIGRHSLESSGSGAAFSARYVNPKSGRYDGVHLYGENGCRDYTDSVRTILMLALPLKPECGTTQPDDHNSCEQAKYLSKPRYQPSVKTCNRFSVFNSNMGN